jgi:hypothetical protein
MKHRITGYVRLFALVSFIAAFALPAAADTQDGTLRDQLIQVLESVAGGKCPEALLAPGLMSQCEELLEVMQKHISSLGAITGADYREITTLPNGVEVEVYQVKFTEGTMIWGVAAGPDGKLSAITRRQE